MSLKRNYQRFIIPVVFLATGFCYSQKDLKQYAYVLSQTEQLLKHKEIDSALLQLESLDTLKLNASYLARFHELYGSILLSVNLHGESHSSFHRAKFLYDSLGFAYKEQNINLKIIQVDNRTSPYKEGMEETKREISELILEYCIYAKTCMGNNEISECYSLNAARYLHLEKSFESNLNFDKAISYAEKANDSSLIIKNSFNKAIVYKVLLKDLDSAMYYYKKIEPIILKSGNKNNIAALYNNQAEIYQEYRQYQLAKHLYLKALNLNLKEDGLHTQWKIIRNLTKNYELAGNYEKAFKTEKRKDIIGDSLDKQTQYLSILKNRIKYQSVEKEKRLLISKQKEKETQDIAVGLGGSLVAVFLIGFLLFKNTKKKQRIAEQQRELEIQKTEKILKEQELTTIDAMIAGQEKERQRLASDLHDSVGATLAAAKLQFDHLSKNKSKLGELDELFNKTEKLLDDAYTEVRSMAHAKNSGVLAKDGLLPAVLKLAKNASGTNQLQIDIQDFGLEERLENSLEITVFRIIQELVTNIIKHAKASEANISITQHEDSLNIMVEDNGIGFKPLETPKTKDGMGLDSIERRVEHLEGSMDVDSSEEKGTTIVIDIPL